MTAHVLISIASLLMVASGAMLYLGLAVGTQRRRVLSRLAAVAVASSRSAPPHGIWTALAVSLSRKIGSSRSFIRNSRLVRRAGFFRPMAPHEYAAITVVASGALGAIAAASALAVTGTAAWSALAGVAGGLFGYLAPGFVLRRLAAHRQRQIDQEMPYFIDTFVILVRAGAGVEQAFRSLRQLIDRALPVTHHTIVYLVDDLDSGKSYEVALRRWRDRLGHRVGPDLVAILTQSLSHGTGLAQPLNDLSDREIERRRMDARERGGKRMLQLTVIMVVFLLPPLLVLIGAPSIAQLLNGFGQLQ